MIGGDLSNRVNNFIVFDSELLYTKRVPKWRISLRMGKNEYHHEFIRYLFNLFNRNKHLSIGMFCFKSEKESLDELIEEYRLPVTQVFVIDDYEDLKNLPVVIERLISNEMTVLRTVNRSLDYGSCKGIY